MLGRPLGRLQTLERRIVQEPPGVASRRERDAGEEIFRGCGSGDSSCTRRSPIDAGQSWQRLDTSPRGVAATSASERPRRGANWDVARLIVPLTPGRVAAKIRFTFQGLKPASVICRLKADGSSALIAAAATAVPTNSASGSTPAELGSLVTSTSGRQSRIWRTR